MSREFIDAIASGDNLDAENEFNNSISSKVGDALEIRRKEISQTFAGNDEVVESGQAAYQRSRAARKMGDTEHKVAYASGPVQPKKERASRKLDQMSKAKIGPTTRTTTMNTGR